MTDVDALTFSEEAQQRNNVLMGRWIYASFGIASLGLVVAAAGALAGKLNARGRRSPATGVSSRPAAAKS
jgi:hypothetical protein